MTTNNPISQYVLGSTDAEHERLIRQATRGSIHSRSAYSAKQARSQRLKHFLQSRARLRECLCAQFLHVIEIRPLLEVGHQPKLLRLPSQELPGSLARSRAINANKVRHPAKVIRGLFGRLADDRHVQAAADDLGDFPERNAFVGNPVIRRRSIRTLLQAKSVEMGGVESVHSGPMVESIAHVRRNALFPRNVDKSGDKTVIPVPMDRRRKAKDRHTNPPPCHSERGLFRFPWK